MDELFWDEIEYFDKDENWGDWRKVNPYLIKFLDKFRKLAGVPVNINNAYSTAGHSKTSKHYLGEAADIHIKGMNVVDQYLLAEKCGLFAGIGVYPFWNNPGLHVDIRTNPARWGRNAAGVYVELNSKFIGSCLNG